MYTISTAGRPRRLVATAALLLATVACASTNPSWQPVPKASTRPVEIDATRIERGDGGMVVWIRELFEPTLMNSLRERHMQVRIDCRRHEWMFQQVRLVTRRGTVMQDERLASTRVRELETMRPASEVRTAGEWLPAYRAVFDVAAVCARGAARRRGSAVARAMP